MEAGWIKHDLLPLTDNALSTASNHGLGEAKRPYAADSFSGHAASMSLYAIRRSRTLLSA